MSEFTEHDYISDHVPLQDTPRLAHKRYQKHSTSSVKIHRPVTPFYCNDCEKKFRSRILANHNTNAVQHYCALYAKVITRKVNTHSTKCQGDHGLGPCVVRRTDIDSESDGADETKATYYAKKSKEQPNFKPCRAYTKKRKRVDDYVSTPSKRQRRNHTRCPPPYSVGYYQAHNISCNTQPSSPPPILPCLNTVANHIDNDDRQHQPEQTHTVTTNTEFEVLCIKKHIFLDNKQVLYNVAWKPCFYGSLDEFTLWLKEVKKIKKVKNDKISYKVYWKDSWVKREDLNCPDLFAAYVLIDLKRKSETEAARNQFKQSCCQMLHYALNLQQE
eukprot:106583_1